MAGNDPDKQLLTLIREFASEKSQGERRVIGLKKRIEELQSQVEAAYAELEDVKRSKEITEQELKGYELELALSDASVQTLESRISLVQAQISSLRSDLETLKSKEAALRDDFLKQMLELNSRIRKFHEAIASNMHKERYIGHVAEEKEKELVTKEDTEVELTSIKNMLAQVQCEIAKEEEEYQSEQNIQKQIQQDLIDCERRVSLEKAIVKERREFEDLTKQTSELETMYASLGEELQRRCICPSCHLDNSEALAEILQGNEES